MKTFSLGRFTETRQLCFFGLKLNQTLKKNMNMGIWVVRTSNHLFIRGSYNEIRFSKNKVVSDKAPFFVIGPF